MRINDIWLKFVQDLIDDGCHAGVINIAQVPEQAMQGRLFIRFVIPEDIFDTDPDDLYAIDYLGMNTIVGTRCQNANLMTARCNTFSQ